MDLPERLGEALEAKTAPQAVIVDSIDVWIANLLLEHEKKDQQDLEQRVLCATGRLLDLVGKSTAAAFLVSAEVGLTLVPAEPLGRRFQDLLGLVNQRIAQAAGRVTLVVAGLPVIIKDVAAP